MSKVRIAIACLIASAAAFAAPAAPVPPAPVPAAPALPASAPGGAAAPSNAALPAAPPSWPMAHLTPDRYSAYPMAISASDLALSWQYAPPSVAEANLGPVVVNDIVYCAAGTAVYAVKLSTGEAAWAAPYVAPPPPGEATPLLSSTPAYLNGKILVGSGDGAMHVLDASTGKSIQDIPCDGAIKSSPAVVGNTVYFGSDHGTIYAFQDTPGGTGLRQLWTRNLNAGDSVRGAVSVNAGAIFAATASGRVFSISTDGGADLTPSNNLQTAITFGPLSTPSGIYVVSQNRLYDLMPTGLRPKWVLPFADTIAAEPAYSNGVLYIVTHNGLVYAYDTARTAVVWSYPLDPASAPRATPVVAGDTVILTGASGHVYAFTRAGDGQGHGQLLWTYVALPTPEYEVRSATGVPDIVAQPAVYGSHLLVVEGNGTLNDLSTAAYEGQGPVVDQMYPVGGPYPAEPAPTVTARVRDPGSGLLPGSLQLFVDGKEIPRKTTDNSLDGYAFNGITGKLTYTPRTPFADGSHTVTIHVSNNRHIGAESPPWTFSVTHRALGPTGPGGGFGGGPFGRGGFGRGGFGRGGFGGGGFGGGGAPNQAG